MLHPIINGAQSFTINTVAITCMHLLSNQLAINPQLQSTILLSIIICHQIFDLLLILIFTNFFPEYPQKIEKFLKIWNNLFSGKLCVGMVPAYFVASSKGINLLKDINNNLYIHYKDKAYNTQATYRCARNTETDAKRVAVVQ